MPQAATESKRNLSLYVVEVRMFQSVQHFAVILLRCVLCDENEK